MQSKPETDIDTTTLLLLSAIALAMCSGGMLGLCAWLMGSAN